MKIKQLLEKTIPLLISVTLALTVQTAIFAAENNIEQAPNISAATRLNEIYSTGFEENKILTRQEFCVYLAKILYEHHVDESTPPFADSNLINPENVKYINTLYKNQILSGTAENGALYMKPDEKITRQEAFTLLGKVIKQTSDTPPQFTDANSIAPWAAGYISWLSENEILSGYPDGSLGPKDTITAGQAIIFISKTVEHAQKQNTNITDTATGITTNSANVTSYYGTGSRGLANGTSINARFTQPYGITTNKAGDLIVFDTYNNVIRKITDNSIVTIVGSIADLDEQRLPKGYYQDGKLSTAMLNRPTDGVYNSKGELIICDSGNNVIRLIKDGNMYTFSGTTKGYAGGKPQVAKYNSPQALAIDKNDNIYVADTLNNCIRKIDSKGTVVTIAGIPGSRGYADGDSRSALFSNPSGIAVSDDGKTIYISDTSNHKIRKLENGTVTTIAGTTNLADEDGTPLGGFADGNAETAMFNQPLGIALSGGIIIIADSGNNKIRAITENGNIITLAGTGEPGDKTGPAQTAEFDHPSGVYVSNGTLYIADTTNNKIKSMPFNASLYSQEGN